MDTVRLQFTQTIIYQFSVYMNVLSYLEQKSLKKYFRMQEDVGHQETNIRFGEMVSWLIVIIYFIDLVC